MFVFDPNFNPNFYCFIVYQRAYQIRVNACPHNSNLHQHIDCFAAIHRLLPTTSQKFKIILMAKHLSLALLFLIAAFISNVIVNCTARKTLRYEPNIPQHVGYIDPTHIQTDTPIQYFELEGAFHITSNQDKSFEIEMYNGVIITVSRPLEQVDMKNARSALNQYEGACKRLKVDMKRSDKVVSTRKVERKMPNGESMEVEEKSLENDQTSISKRGNISRSSHRMDQHFIISTSWDQFRKRKPMFLSVVLKNSTYLPPARGL
uniref:AlNc14C205G8789 protein n=1 Tax=Albugo laibachii Nc14 TaxID=890382 RepID=F0WQY1_9STRA|nr:AlNc14C205G8789 [Albugo laibachii Nc14]|eukprot:CCA23741.1 AlNc14C205G8789 [Albugo laibachii Nc14]